MNITRVALQEELWSLQDHDYQSFNCRLLPATIRDTVIGVKLPNLRKLSKAVAQEIGPDAAALSAWYKQYISNRGLPKELHVPGKAKLYYEERLISGFVIAYSEVALPEKSKLIKAFVEKMDNWAVCDSFCNTFHPHTKEDFDAFTNLIETWLTAYSNQKIKNPYILRFIVVLLLSKFYMDETIDYALSVILQLESSADTVKMARAWAISQYIALHPEDGLIFLRETAPKALDLETHQLTVRKVCDSLKVDKAFKSIARSLLKDRKTLEKP